VSAPLRDVGCGVADYVDPLALLAGTRLKPLGG
jgi:hypothetical protein